MRAGEPLRLVHALAVEAMYSSTGGDRSRRRTGKLLARTGELAARLGRPEARFWNLAARGLASYLAGRFRVALGYLEQAEAVCRDECTGMAFELDTVRLFLVMALQNLGRMAEVARRVPGHVAEAMDRGDLYGATNLEVGPQCAWLLAVGLEEARRRAREASSRWSQRGFQLQHWWALLTAAQLDLYAGDGRAAFDRVMEHWRVLSGALVLRAQLTRGQIRGLHGRCALALAAEVRGSAEERRRLAEAEQSGGLLLRGGVAWMHAQAELIAGPGSPPPAATPFSGAAPARGGRRLRRGRHGPARGRHPAPARREILGGDEGEALCAAADAWMGGERIAEPRRFTAMLAPGFPG